MLPPLSSSSSFALASCANTPGDLISGIGSCSAFAADASGALGVAILKTGTPAVVAGSVFGADAFGTDAGCTLATWFS